MNDARIRYMADDFIRRFGGGAAMEAAHIAEKKRLRGDIQGAELWTRIAAILRSETEEMPSKHDSEYWD